MTIGLLSFVSQIPVTATRVLVIGYGQSNMGSFMTDDTGSAPSPNTNCLYYDGYSYGSHVATNTTISPVGYGSGMLTCINKINNVTGLPVLFVGNPVGGNAIQSLIPGTPAWSALSASINAVIQPTDYVVMVWDQGEGDSAFAPPEVPQDYIGYMTQIQQGLAAITGISTSPVLVAGLGTIGGLTGAPSGGNSPFTWQRVRNATFFCGVQIPHVYYAYTNIDILRANASDYHYIQNTPMGQRFGQGVTNLMGIGAPGFAHWEISNAATVNATQTNVNFIHSLGTDFTPTSNADGWEVSGDNGANWVTALGARNSATQLQLTHASLSTSNARLVRYQWGYNQAGLSAGPTPGILRDNSSITVPLTPTTWDIKTTGSSSTIPCATWRNVDTSSRNPNPLSQNTRTIQCFPSTDNYQKFLILPIFSGFAPDMVHNPITVTVTPNIGSFVTATFVGQHPTVNYGLTIFQAPMLLDSKDATYYTLNVASGQDTFTNFTIHVFDVPTAALNSTTNTGTNNSVTTLTTNTTPPLTSNCTVNASTGGLMISMNYIDQQQGPGTVPFATYSSNFNNRWEDGSTVVLDAVNASNGSNSFSISFGTTNPLAPINMYTYMASWR